MYPTQVGEGGDVRGGSVRYRRYRHKAVACPPAAHTPAAWQPTNFFPSFCADRSIPATYFGLFSASRGSRGGAERARTFFSGRKKGEGKKKGEKEKKKK